MPKMNQLFPSKYLKAADLNGKAWTVTIAGVDFEEVGQDRELKPIMHFVGTEKGLVLNKTNGMTCEIELNSDDTDDWVGQKVKLVAEKVTFGGKIVDSIRIKGPNEATKAPDSGVMGPPGADPDSTGDDPLPF